MVLEVYKTTDS